MPKPLLRKQQMHCLSPNNILIHHLPNLQRQHGKECTLPLHVRPRIKLLVHDARKTDDTLPPLERAVVGLAGLAAQEGAFGAVFGFLRAAGWLDVVRDPAHAGEEGG